MSRAARTKQAVVLLSGGLDSTTLLYLAKSQGFSPVCLVFTYGQRHSKEVRLAAQMAESVGSPHTTVKIPMPWQGSSLLDKNAAIPDGTVIDTDCIPSTYVPARNIIFLSFAVAYAEAVGARDVFIGANAVDYSGYPDCRPAFFDAYQKAVCEGTKSGVAGRPVRIRTPLVNKTKAQIIRLGMKLGVPYGQTWSCYRGGRKPCGRCDSCVLRQKGFMDAGMTDPALG